MSHNNSTCVYCGVDRTRTWRGKHPTRCPENPGDDGIDAIAKQAHYDLRVQRLGASSVDEHYLETGYAGDLPALASAMVHEMEVSRFLADNAETAEEYVAHIVRYEEAGVICDTAVEDF